MNTALLIGLAEDARRPHLGNQVFHVIKKTRTRQIEQSLVPATDNNDRTESGQRRREDADSRMASFIKATPRSRQAELRAGITTRQPVPNVT